MQEALVWHERMLRARAHAAERGFGKGMLDAVLGGRPAEVSKPAVDVKWASIWTLTEASANTGGIQKRTRRPIYNNIVNCMLALGSFQVSAILYSRFGCWTPMESWLNSRDVDHYVTGGVRLSAALE